MANPKRVPATVSRLMDHGSGVYSAWFDIAQEATIFKPGQFLHLALDSFSPEEGYWPESRVFSIASSPGKDTIRIVFSVKGSFTRRMSLELTVGKSVWLKYPFGDFVVDCGNRGDTLVLVAGGTGITPFIPLLSGRNRRLDSLWLYYGIRTLELLIFGEELASACRESGLNLSVLSEEASDQEPRNFQLKNGKLDISEILAFHGSGVSTHYYLSGPPGMIDAFKSYLLHNSVRLRNIHIDAWE